MECPDIRQTNLSLAFLYLSSFGSLFVGGLLGGSSLLAWLPFLFVVVVILIYDHRLTRIKRPCGHMSIRQGGKLGFYTPFIKRVCPMCGDRMEDGSRSGAER